MKKWMVYSKKADFAELGRRYNIDQVIARIIRNRDVIELDEIEKYLYGSVKDLYAPERMLNLSRAVELIMDAVRNKQKLRIIGDYDIDGISSIYILYQGLLRIGAEVDYDIPDRIEDGYGINENLITKAQRDGCEVLITCDNGIAAAKAVEYAKSLGMTVIVTDHHEVPFEMVDGEKKYILPPADVVVDPKQPGETYPFHELCGAGVAFKLITLLYDRWNIPSEEAMAYIEMAGFATVGDIVNLQDENRILVKEAIKRLRRTTNLGLNALITLTNTKKEQISAYHIGFIIGPCLNASGRLDTAKRAVRMLCEKDREEAERLAGDLKSLNDERKDMTQKASEEAIQWVLDHHMESDLVLVVYLPECHESIAGIVAGKIRERFYRPSIVLTKGHEGVKGSARSIEEYNIFEKLTECKELMTKFGGHPMAAGLSLPEENIDALRKQLNENAKLSEQELTEKIWIDVPMPINYITEKLIHELNLLEPFGKANTKPIFADKNLSIVSVSAIGKQGQYTKMSLQKEGGFYMEAVGFFDPKELIAAKVDNKRVDCVYYPEINEYRGNQKLQITINEYRIHD